MTQLQRARITGCPHGGKHNGVDGYIVDTYADGTVAIDMGFNHTCITSSWENLSTVRREDARVEDEALDALAPEPATPKRRGRPPKTTSSIPEPESKPRRGRLPKAQSPLEKVLDEAEAELAELHSQKSNPSPAAVGTTKEPVLTILAIQDNRVTLSYRRGTTSVEAAHVSKNDLAALNAVIKALTHS